VQFIEKVQAKWQEGYYYIMTMPDTTQPKQPRRVFKNCSGILNILTSQAWPPVISSVWSCRNHLAGKFFAESEEVEMEVQKWLRQQPKDCYAAGFSALVKQWVKCIYIGGGYVKK
jgi:hypothetical protein